MICNIVSVFVYGIFWVWFEKVLFIVFGIYDFWFVVGLDCMDDIDRVVVFFIGIFIVNELLFCIVCVFEDLFFFIFSCWLIEFNLLFWDFIVELLFC